MLRIPVAGKATTFSVGEAIRRLNPKRHTGRGSRALPLKEDGFLLEGARNRGRVDVIAARLTGAEQFLCSMHIDTVVPTAPVEKCSTVQRNNRIDPAVLFCN